MYILCWAIVHDGGMPFDGIMNDLILILCAGKSTRWTGLTPKQCVLVKGEPLIVRTIKQVRNQWSSSANIQIVTHSGKIWNMDDIVYTTCLGWLHAVPFGLIRPTYDRYICGTLLSTMHLWPDYKRIIVLLGDVVYSPFLLKRIHNDVLPEDIRFYGSKHERWAMVWKYILNGTVVEMLIHSVHLTGQGLALDKLATPFRLCAKHPLRKPYGSEQAPLVPRLYTLWTHDYVDDFDEYDEYKKWLKANPWAQ